MYNKSALAYLMSQDNWEALEWMDQWTFVYDHLPQKMRRMVDLKISGMSNKAIARRLKCSHSNVCVTLLVAKKRILRGENVI